MDDGSENGASRSSPSLLASLALALVSTFALCSCLSPQSGEGKKESVVGKPFVYERAVSGDLLEVPGSSSATAGILVDLGSRRVLWAKNPKEPVPIASMTKMMTVLLAYEDVLSKREGLSLETEIAVTPESAKVGGSQVYLDPRESFSLEELLKAVSIKSANDAAFLVAEKLGGGDAGAFVARMNVRAKEIGMSATRFSNPHGLPEKPASNDNVASPEDLALLAERCLEHPKIMEWASTWSADFRKPGQKGHMLVTNHNHLVPGSPNECPGVDGLKTGFINRSGFCMTVTCKRNGKRLVAVVTGFMAYKDRDAFAKRLLDWGYSADGAGTASGGL